jgi:AcrR family transcriptional regulator
MKKKPAYHHPELRRILLEAAAAELKERGAADLSLRNIANRAGVSHTAPYRHFKNKDEIIALLVWDTVKDFTTALRKARESAVSPKERLFEVGTAYLEFARANPQRLNLMFSETGMGAMMRYLPKPSPEELATYDSFGVLETTVKECQAEGILDPKGDSGAISIEREGFIASLGAQRGLTAEAAHKLVLKAFHNLVERNAKSK